MGAKSEIEWTMTLHADGTITPGASWNPVTGCSKVSPGCANCYAETLSLRRGWSLLPWTPANAATNVVLHPDRLDYPLRWRTGRKIYDNSKSDLFHDQVPDAFIDQVWAVMLLAPQHTFQVLTKRPERMRAYVSDPTLYERVLRAAGVLRAQRPALTAIAISNPTRFPAAHIWLGTSVENQRWANERIPLLLDTPAAVRFLSCEPLLGPVDLDPWFGLVPGNQWDCMCADIDPADRPCVCCEGRRYLGERSGLHWVIVGGESGDGHRPMRAEWVQSLRDQCTAAGVSYFFKQWGGRTPKAGGRLLDGQTWSQFPQAVPA
jgi:protein gp37